MKKKNPNRKKHPKTTELKQQNPLRSRVSHTCKGWFFRKNPGEFEFSAAARSAHGWGQGRITALTAQERILIHTATVIYIPGTQSCHSLGKGFF